MYTQSQKNIIGESIKIIAELGIDSLTIKRIADRLGVTDAAIYKHFASKEEILEGIVHKIEKIFYSEFEEVLRSTESSIDILKMLFLKHCEIVNKNSYNVIIFNSFLYFKKNKKINNYINEIFDSFKYSVDEIIKNGQRKGEIRDDVDNEVIFWTVIGVLNFYIIKWSRYNHFDLKKESPKMWKQVAEMIKPPKK